MDEWNTCLWCLLAMQAWILSALLPCREKIVDGRLSKFAAERSLLEQPFIKDPKISVGQHIKSTIAKLGELPTCRPLFTLA